MLGVQAHYSNKNSELRKADEKQIILLSFLSANNKKIWYEY